MVLPTNLVIFLSLVASVIGRYREGYKDEYDYRGPHKPREDSVTVLPVAVPILVPVPYDPNALATQTENRNPNYSGYRYTVKGQKRKPTRPKARRPMAKTVSWGEKYGQTFHNSPYREQRMHSRPQVQRPFPTFDTKGWGEFPKKRFNSRMMPTRGRFEKRRFDDRHQFQRKSYGSSDRRTTRKRFGPEKPTGNQVNSIQDIISSARNEKETPKIYY